MVTCLFFACNNTLFAQEEDYVISKPKPTKTRKESKRVLYGEIQNPDYTNYFFTASAHTLKSRDIRLSGTDLLFAKGSYGITNYTTASVNISLIGTLMGTLKHRIELNEMLNLAFTADLGLLGTISEDSLLLLGGTQGIITLGDYQDNATFGMGFYYMQSTFELDNGEDNIPLYNILFGVQKQISRKVYLIGDGYYFPVYNLFTGGFGAKFIIKDYMSLLIGLMPITQRYQYINNRQITEAVVLPAVSFRMLLDRH